MNLATKSKIANVLTALAAVIVTVQSFLVNPPFSDHVIFVLGAVLTYLTLVVTTFKQFFSADISDRGAYLTIGILIVSTLAGGLNLLDVFNVSPVTAQWIKWGISMLALMLNILSKTLFPSMMQKEVMTELQEIKAK